ncbi:uncharacterized protein O3C94_013513 [Discoglossus pictus]
MGFHYLSSYRRNSSPMMYWYRGTAFQLDRLKDQPYPEMQAIHTELGADMVILAMAARIMQSAASIARKKMHTRAWYWKLLPAAWLSKALSTLLWIYWGVVNILLTLEMTKELFSKNKSKARSLCHSDINKSSISIKYHWKHRTEQPKKSISEGKAVHENKMEKPEDHMADFDGENHCMVQCNMDCDISRESPLPSCTNTMIVSMVCLPLENDDSSSTDESDVNSEFALEEASSWKQEDSSYPADMSTDSGLQDHLSPCKSEVTDFEEETDWSDDSWDSDDDDSVCTKENDDLWNSFCQNDDPYNPLSFAMPTKSPRPQNEKQDQKTTNLKDLSTTDLDLSQELESNHIKLSVSEKSHDENQYCRTKAMTTRKPTLPSSSMELPKHNCVVQCRSNEYAKAPAELHNRASHQKRVRFSPAVTVHPLVTWSYAHRVARRGPWEEYARDRGRFQRRISETEASIGYCLEPLHRENVWKNLHANK